jgi:ubiquinone/menaquinone biosynthesis C-methylase UbiE
MALVDEYRRQFAWRDWAKALSLCPIVAGQRVLDLGCGPGDISAELWRRGALVTGVDKNDELITAAKERYPQCLFENQDLNTLKFEQGAFDGLWCSFAAAYFTALEGTLSRWIQLLKKSAWICMIDIDDLFGHTPLSELSRKKLLGFCDEAVREGRHDFMVGRKMGKVLENLGFRVAVVDLEDQELSFNGAANPAVIQAWTDRLSRMGGLRAYLKEGFIPFRDEFLASLSSMGHRSQCRVVCCIGSRRS